MESGDLQAIEGLALTLFDKVWNDHVVHEEKDGTTLLYVDRHYVHEVTSPQAFEGLAVAGRQPWRIDTVVATADHNVPTRARSEGIADPVSRVQIETLDRNARRLGVPVYFDMRDERQGIVHVVGPEQGATLPGMTVVCGDSHTSTHGAFGALAFGIGTSEVEHVLATQCLMLKRPKTFRVAAEGQLPRGVTSKDLILSVIGRIGMAGATGCAIEFCGAAIRGMSMEARMTVCNMAIEAGARSGMIGVDEKTIDYLRNRPLAPSGEQFEQAVSYWRTLVSDRNARFDRELVVDAASIAPQVTWGTSPDMVSDIDGCVPDPSRIEDAAVRNSASRALEYMDLAPGTRFTDVPIDKVFIGSCTNARIEDLRAAAKIVEGHRIASRIKLALVVPGSGPVKRQAEKEALDRIFTAAGFEWREPGCSMCLGMNEDQLSPGERCASTSNRNFEGRQGAGGRTHLVSPSMAAAAAIRGHFVDVRHWE